MSHAELSTQSLIRGRESVTPGVPMNLDSAARQQVKKLPKFMHHSLSTSISITNLRSRVSRLVANTQVLLIKLEDFSSVAEMIKDSWALETSITK
jgi:hypothetical protein